MKIIPFKIFFILIFMAFSETDFCQVMAVEDTGLLRRLEVDCGKKETSENLNCLQEMAAISEKNLKRTGLSETLKKEYLTYLGTSMNELGLYYKNKANLMLAIEYYHKSLAICETIGEKTGASAISNNLGTIYSEMGERKKAISYFTKALKAAEQLKNNKGVAISLNNIGLEYYYTGDYETAMDYYKQSMVLREKLNEPRLIALGKQNIGLIFFKQNKLEEAFNFFSSAYEFHSVTRNKRDQAYGCYYLSITYNKLGNTVLAEKFGKKAMELSKECGHPDAIRNAALALREVYEKQKNYQQALLMFELYNRMDDSINNDQNRKASIRKQFQFEYERKAAADSVKHAEEQKVAAAQLTAHDARLKQEKLQFWFLFGGLLFVFAGFIFVINRFRLTRKQKTIIEQQKLQVDEAFSKLAERNKEVMDSIQYAKRIQTTLLTSQAYFHKHLNRLKKR